MAQARLATTQDLLNAVRTAGAEIAALQQQLSEQDQQIEALYSALNDLFASIQIIEFMEDRHKWQVISRVMQLLDEYQPVEE
ncbi:MAG: hypothetical protein ACFE0Q_20650 [Anaerolineae bacterium]